MAHLDRESLASDLIWEVMDQVAHLDRKVSLLLAAAGIAEPARAGSEEQDRAA